MTDRAASKQIEAERIRDLNADYDERYGFFDEDRTLFKAPKGINADLVAAISEYKQEPRWMRDFRLKAYDQFLAKGLPPWISPQAKNIDFDDIHYFVRSTEKPERSWDDVPEDIKRTFEKLGIPEAEQKSLSGVSAQYDSVTAYHHMRTELEAQGVIFVDMDTGLAEHEDLVRKYWATVIPSNDNKFAALNSAVWSGGSFAYVPPEAHVEMPLQAYFRINTENMGQFERTLIIADKGSKVHYVEGCSSPTYSSASLHSAVVELVAHDDAEIVYSTVQNWSAGVDADGNSQGIANMVTKRGIAHARATIRWTDANIGSSLTSKYPSVYLVGEHAHGEILSMAFANAGQHQDAGGKIIHAAPNTTSNIMAKSISKGGGRSTYRGLMEVAKHAENSKSTVVCDALLLDEESRTDTYPTIRIGNSTSDIGHEATVSKVGDEQIFYLMSHGLSEEEASKMIVNGFVEPIIKALPMEYAVELNRLVDLEMEGSIG